MSQKWKGGREAAQKRYREKHREKRNARNREYYRKNRNKIRVKRIGYQRKNKEKIYAYNKRWIAKYRAKLKKETLAAYGNKCVCCEEKNPMFLTLDHIKNDGKEHRKKFPTTVLLQVWLKKHNWPKNIVQVLCFNCNLGKHQNGGICPHKMKNR
jgi:hypothetical protein